MAVLDDRRQRAERARRPDLRLFRPVFRRMAARSLAAVQQARHRRDREGLDARRRTSPPVARCGRGPPGATMHAQRSREPPLRRFGLTLHRREHRAQHACVLDDRNLLHALLSTSRTYLDVNCEHLPERLSPGHAVALSLVTSVATFIVRRLGRRRPFSHRIRYRSRPLDPRVTRTVIRPLLRRRTGINPPFSPFCGHGYT